MQGPCLGCRLEVRWYLLEIQDVLPSNRFVKVVLHFAVQSFNRIHVPSVVLLEIFFPHLVENS